MSSAQTTVINGKVYCGGGDTDGGDDDDYADHHFVYCYDLSQDSWTTLPPLPVRWFSLGQVNGNLVAVGGIEGSFYNATNEVYTYDERSREWKQTVPPMPTARHSTGVLSLQSVLVVAGGDISDIEYDYADEVEIFKADTSQWYRTDRLPKRHCSISPAICIIGNTCYALGGCRYPTSLNQSLYASVDDLLRNAVPANETTYSGSSDTLSAWKTLANTPTYAPISAVLAGNLLAIGGKETPLGGAVKKEVYMFSPSTNSWIYISDLPEPRSYAAVAVLSSTEILVIGGWCDMSRVSTTYKGTLMLKV